MTATVSSPRGVLLPMALSVIMGACIDGRELGECVGTCGANTTCAAGGGTCACLPGWIDCNEDLGQKGGDGCECDGDCQSCGSSVACNPGELRSCRDNRRFCEQFSRVCRACPAQAFDCDGLSKNECEHDGPCAGQIVCDPGALAPCGDDKLFCDPPLKLCQDCPVGRRNCDGESSNGCETSRLCRDLPCDPKQAFSCGSETMFCDTVLGACRPCAEEHHNCDGKGLCEPVAGACAEL